MDIPEGLNDDVTHAPVTLYRPIPESRERQPARGSLDKIQDAADGDGKSRLICSLMGDVPEALL